MDDSNVSYETFEPMDVDTSGRSNEKFEDITLISTTDEHYPASSPSKPSSEADRHTNVHRITRDRVKKYHIKIDRRVKDNARLKVWIITSTLISLSVSVITYHLIRYNCSVELDLEQLHGKLSSNLYGQPAAIKGITETLAEKFVAKILFLYGGTGVGKTYASSFILEKIWRSTNVYHYAMPNFITAFPSDFRIGMTVCPSSTLVLDDLKESDIDDIKPHIKEVIEKSENQSKNITVILIFNCDIISNNFVKKCDSLFGDYLVKNFSDVTTVKRFIKFEPLTQEHLKKCIMKEINKQHLKEYNMDNILRNFNVTLDGCKGVYTKLKFF